MVRKVSADVTFTCVQNDEKEPAMRRAVEVSLQKEELKEQSPKVENNLISFRTEEKPV